MLFDAASNICQTVFCRDVELSPAVVKERLVDALHLGVLLVVIVDFVLQILSFRHDLGEIGKTYRDYTHWVYCSCAEGNFVLSDAADGVEHATVFFQLVKDDVLVPQMKVELNLARCKDKDTLVDLVLIDDDLSWLVDFILKVDDQFFVSLDIQVSKIRNVQELELLPAPVFVLVLNEVLLHFVFYVWEDGDDLIESVFVDEANITIVLGLDSCCSPLICDEGDFSEVLTWLQNLYKCVFSVFILDPDFTFTLGYEEQFVWNLALSDDDFFWVKHLQLHFRKQEVDEFSFVLKHVVFFDDVLEDELEHLLFEWWRDVLDEQVQLLLILLRLLSKLKETYNFGLQIGWDFDVLHRCIDLV
jgi:hypothetical protein